MPANEKIRNVAGSRKARPVDDDDVQEIEVRLGSVKQAPVENIDPFAQKAEDIKVMSGLDPNFKRRVSREMTKFLQGDSGVKSKRIDFPVTGYSLFDCIMPPYNLDYLAALYEKSDAHAAAVKAKAYNIVGLGYDFLNTPVVEDNLAAAEGNEKRLKRLRKELTNAKNTLNDWLDSCNQEDEFAETLLKVWIDYETLGNGYVEIGRDTRGMIRYIGHIPASTIRIRRLRDGFIQIADRKQVVFFRHFGDRKTPNPIGGDNRPNEVIHIKKYTPTNSYYGVPDIIAAMAAVTGNDFAARYNLDYFENKAVPRYVVVVKGGRLTQNSEKSILEFFQTNLKGVNHRTLYVPLPADSKDQQVSFEMKPVEANVQESSFNAYRTANLSSILMAHRVPITKVTLMENVNLAAARDADKTFKESVTRPEQDILEKKLNKVFKEITDMFNFSLNELSLTDENTQSQIDERNIRNQIVVPNEVRSRMGKPGLPEGDKVVPNSAQLQAERAAQQGNTRERSQNRDANRTDTAGEARNPKGDGKTTP